MSNLVDVHVLHRTPKVSSPGRITEGDSGQGMRSLHSSVQLLYSVIKNIVLCRSRRCCRPRILKSLITTCVILYLLTLIILLVKLLIVLIFFRAKLLVEQRRKEKEETEKQVQCPEGF